MKRTYYYFLISESHERLGLFDDLKRRPDVTYLVCEQKQLTHRIPKLIKRIHTSWSINKRIPLPFRKHWYKKLQIDFPADTENYILITDLALKGITDQDLKKMRGRENNHLILILLNSCSASSIGMLEVREDIRKNPWEKVYTFDPMEAEKYQWNYLGVSYYSMSEPVRKAVSKKKTDIYFVGGVKGGRGEKLEVLAKYLFEKGIQADINVMLTGRSKLGPHRYVPGIHYYNAEQWIPYEQVLSSVKGCNVILDLVQEGQNGPSLRYFEAVIFNKKLLTTNKCIKGLPYYDEKYMKVFSTLDDIDIRWISEETEVDYHYKGDFSPVNLLNRICKE